MAKYYQEAGYRQLNRNDKSEMEALIARYKSEGRDNEIQNAKLILQSSNEARDLNGVRHVTPYPFEK